MFELCLELDEKYDLGRVEPDDIETELRVGAALETVLDTSESFPEVPEVSTAGELARLLWFRSHPDEARVAYVLDRLQKGPPITRATAAETLTSLLRSKRLRAEEQETLLASRTVLEERSHDEPARLIAHRIEVARQNLSSLTLARQPESPVRPNPYVAGMPVRGNERFFDREEVLAKIRATLGPRPGITSVILHGARRTGKTSILLRIKDGALGGAFVPVYIDMQAMGGGQVDRLLRHLVAEISTALWEKRQIPPDRLPDPTGELDFLFFTQFLEAAMEHVRSASLLVMLDEYEVLGSYMRDSDFAGQFQALFTNVPGFYCIFAGSQKVENLQEKSFLFLLDISQYIKISFLERRDVAALITEPSRGVLEFDRQTIDRIYRLTGGHPFFVQLICQAIFDRVGDDGRVSIEHLDATVEEFLLNPSPYLVLSWKMLSIDQTVVGAAIAALEARAGWVSPEEVVDHLREEKHPVRLRRPEVMESLSKLKEIDWIEKKRGENEYRFTMEIVRRWVGENRSIWEILADLRKTAFSQVAGPWRQISGWAIDFAATLIITVVANYFAAIALGNNLGDWSRLLSALAMLAAGLYFLLPLWRHQATPGMMLTRIRLLNRSGVSARPARGILVGVLLSLRMILWLRALAAYPDQLFPYDINLGLVLALLAFEGLECLLVFIGKSRRELVQKIAGTLVCRRVPAGRER